MALADFVLGTRNKKKREELDHLLRPHGFQVRSLEDFDDAIEVVEDGKTFADNAAKKAAQQALHLGEWVLGEDSGICVDALDGRPGVFSARFSGLDATDASNNRLMLEELANVPLEKRTAYYVCHMTLADPHGDVHIDCEATCRGRLRFQPAGRGGFGYDPLFEIVEYHVTFGELGKTVKSVLSHRARRITAVSAKIAEAEGEYGMKTTDDLIRNDGGSLRQNIEIKAHIRDVAEIVRRSEQIATDVLPTQRQVDTYFHCERGRLKLRKIDSDDGTVSAQLIHYVREDVAGAKPSHYRIALVADSVALAATLASAYGIWKTVKKRRRIFLHRNVRIHVDEVQGLGDFVELEAVQSPEMDRSEQLDLVDRLREELGIGDDDLLVGSYSDMMAGA